MINTVILTGPCYISKFDDPDRDVVKFQVKHRPYKDAEYEYLPCEAWDNKFKTLATDIRDNFGESSERGPGKPIELIGQYRSRKYESKDGTRTATYVEVTRLLFPAKDYSAENATSTDDNDETSSSDPFPF